MDANDILPAVSRATAIKQDGIIFVSDSLGYAISLKKTANVNAKELCDGFALYGAQMFGGLVLSVFNHWGIHSTEDIGRCVFALIEAKAFISTPGDKQEDFIGLYDFEDRFEMKKVVDEILTIDSSASLQL